MAAEGQSDGGERSALGEHFRDLGRQVGCGRHQHLAQVASPRGGLLRRPARNTTVTREALRCRHAIQVAGAAYTYFSFWVSSLKMCTVSVLLEADRYRPSMLNASEQMLTHLIERAEAVLEIWQTTVLPLNSLPFDSSPELKELLALGDGEDANDCSLRGSDRRTQMRATAEWEEKRKCDAEPPITFSDAVANLVPLASKARAANGLSWAGIMLAARCRENGESGERCNAKRKRAEGV